ncbi:glycosyltransferase family 39 protein [Patescibacteria group bacterium]|nr:glycosyltransferase family 39 protein [Patescibacteria group bacterium]
MTLEAIIKKLSLLFTLFLGGLLFLSVFGFFSAQNVRVLLYVCLAMILLFLIKNFVFDKIRLRFAKSDIVAVLLILIFAFLAFQFHHDLQRGRDEMVHLASAIKLSHSGSLAFEDPLARTFSGFDHIKDNFYTSQFLPGYISLLAAFYSVSGLNFVYAANAMLIFFSLSAIYFLGKRLRSPAMGLVAVSWLGTFYAVLWFSKRLNSEILFMALFWLVIWYFFDALKLRRWIWYFLSFIPLTLMLLTRGEGFIYFLAYLFFSILILAKTPTKTDERIVKKRNVFVLIFPVGVIAILVAYLIKYNSNYLLSQINNYQAATSSISPIIFVAAIIAFVLFIYYSFFSTAQGSTEKIKQKQRILLYIILAAIVLFELLFAYKVYTDSLTWSFFRVQFSLEIMTLYFVFAFALFIFRGLYTRVFSKETFYLTLFVLPSFIFLIESNIAPDQPWFMRRFLAVFIPYIILMAAFVFVNIKTIVEKKVLLFVGVLIINLVISLPVLVFVDNKGVSTEIESFLDDFSGQDLLLMEPGWDWQKWAYAMRYVYHVNVLPNLNLLSKEDIETTLKQAANQYPAWQESNEDLLAIRNIQEQKNYQALKPIIASYQNVYVLSTSAFAYPYYDVLNLKMEREFELDYRTLEPSTQILGYIKTSGDDMDINVIRESQRNTPPRRTEEVKNDFLLLKVVDKDEVVFGKEMSEEEVVEYRAYLGEVLGR